MMKKFGLIFLLATLWLVSATGAQAQLLLRGDVNYWTYDSRVRIEADHITNFGGTTTEQLRVRLWASEHHWSVARPGRVIAVGALPRLAAYQSRSNLHRTLHLHTPPTGWYYVTLTLEERTLDEGGAVSWKIRDVVEFDGQEFFRRGFLGWPFPF